jgi:hypothetical protein
LEGGSVGQAGQFGSRGVRFGVAMIGETDVNFTEVGGLGFRFTNYDLQFLLYYLPGGQSSCWTTVRRRKSNQGEYSPMQDARTMNLNILTPRKNVFKIVLQIASHLLVPLVKMCFSVRSTRH